MRPSWLLGALFCALILAAGGMGLSARQRAAAQDKGLDGNRALVAALHLSDLCISTEARYTRHPAASDAVVPFMDHPGAIEHFPSGSFFAPPPALPRYPNPAAGR
ncbi:MAG: hypothetical protein AB1568_00770 [Thermodesulfobacteriota bacterium]